MANHVRWYLNISKWKPTKDEWLKLTSSIASEEVERINKFQFQDDSKCSLIGCALIRKFLSLATGLPSNEFILNRSQHGRPEISKNFLRQRNTSNDWPNLLDFNVSHSGDYCVFAGVWLHKAIEPIKAVRIGVDVTKIVKKKTTQELDRFLSLMSRREFTKEEWSTVERAGSERQKCVNFTRLWCLKESFIKANGLGLSFKLNQINFRFSETDLSMGSLKNGFIESTTVLTSGKLASDWLFFETALDDEHFVALAYNIEASCPTQQAINNIAPQSGPPFVELSVQSIVEALTPIDEVDDENWSKFSIKQIKSVG